MIRSVSHVRHALRRPMITAHGTIRSRVAAIVTIESDGQTGQGEASTLPGFGLEDQDSAVAALDEWMRGGDAPTTQCAASAVATAEANLDAARQRVSLAEFLNPDASSSVRTQAVVGDGDIDTAVHAASAAVASGVGAIKVKVAAMEPNADIERVRNIRRAIGDRIALRLDANGGWDHPMASHVLSVVADFMIDFVEEPTNDPAEFPLIAQASGIRVALDEHACDTATLERAVESGIDVVVLKPAVLGGPRRTYQLAMQLLDRDVDVVISSFIDGPIGLDAATQVAAALPTEEIHGLGTASLFRQPFPDHLVVRNGRLLLKQ